MIYNSRSRNSDTRVFVAAADDDTVVGYLTYANLDDRTGQVSGWYLRKQYHGTGLAGKLMDAVRACRGRRDVITSTTERTRAMAAYKKAGFVEDTSIALDDPRREPPARWLEFGCPEFYTDGAGNLARDESGPIRVGRQIPLIMYYLKP
ncbi:GNAT family N-acetyltransferase [Nocardia sp. GAS34]|uniref:GNAT family N-acetyltransferase n=1 Tax=unclassified Nocardia TaxID=2637762 RepID=UPI003D1E806E